MPVETAKTKQDMIIVSEIYGLQPNTNETATKTIDQNRKEARIPRRIIFTL